MRLLGPRRVEARRSGLRTRRGLGSAVALLALASAACDSGPAGSGTLEVRLRADALGAALVEVQGGGIQGFAARGGARVYSAPFPGRADVYRVIVLDEAGGDLGFEIQVDDVGMEGPVLTVITAAGVDDEPLSAGVVQVTVER